MSVSVIIPFNLNSPVFRYFDIHFDGFAGQLAPGTTLCGHIVQSFSGMTPQDRYVIIPRDHVPPDLDLPLPCLLVSELPPNLQYVGYVSARPSAHPLLSHRPTYVVKYL
jgi:hypothetical protein